ncbi:Patatin [Rickettsiales bacterium Ac37b]|nr:Patatin [Rickettsiales bacterium Ac37b]
MKIKKKIVHLALQGGGAHGAFTWGILDKLLEDGRLDIDGIAATSAGSMNAIMYSYGYMEGGIDGARQKLYDFWQHVSSYSSSFIPDYPPLEKLYYQMMYIASISLGSIFSPYQSNPYNINFLKNILDQLIDFDKLKACKCNSLFISATNVRSGNVKVFTNKELSIEVVLASAALPNLYQAVKVGQDYYWDGGYMGNPPIFPLFYHGKTRDVIIVHINPMYRHNIPKTANEIANRINEITFNSSLLKEFRSIAFVNKLIEEKWLKDKFASKLRHILVHSIRADHALRDYDVASKFDSSWKFLTHLRDIGRHTASNWLHEHFSKIGKISTVDLYKDFLNAGSN